MHYDFETVRPRYQSGSAKWNEVQAVYPEMPQDIVPFSVADMECPTAPEIVEGLKRFLDTSVLGYSNATDTFKASVCRWMRERHHWETKPEWILPTHGCVEAFYAAVKCFTQPGDGVLLLTPVYYPMYSAISQNGRKLVDCSLVRRDNTYDINWEDFEAKIREDSTKLFLLCSPHNPCGRVWTREELTRMADLCNRHGVLVVSDEIHNDLIMPGYTHTVYATLSPEAEQNCVVLTAPSKTFNLAGLQTSNIFIPNDQLREKFMAHLKTIGNNPKCNILGYEACRIAYEQCGGWLDECLRVIHRNQQLVTEFCARHFPQIQICQLQATYLLWMDWNGLGLSYQELEERNHRQAKLFFDEGYVFGPQGEGFERWNLACPTRVIEQGLERMLAAYQEFST